MLAMIASIYQERSFVLKDSLGPSTLRQQNAGIAQGCPLSPYLFILVQTVMLFDVDQRVKAIRPLPDEPAYIVCKDLLYAGGTMLIGSQEAHLQLQLDTIIDEGCRYGLELNWGKTVAIQYIVTSTCCSHRVNQSTLSRRPSISVV